MASTTERRQSRLLGLLRWVWRLLGGGFRSRVRRLDPPGEKAGAEEETAFATPLTRGATHTGTRSQIDALTGREIDRPQDTVHVPIEALPQYEFLKWVSSGSYGSVWAVRIRATESIRALKIMHRDGFPSEEAYERELGGMKAYEEIASEHPGLIDILYAEKREDEEHGRFYFYLMRLAEDVSGLPCREKIAEDLPGVVPADYEAHTLGSELRRRGRLPVPRAIEIGRALALALNHLHEHHLVHRDVKPSNVLFLAGQPLLADVGLVARESDDATRMGSLPYVPPEGTGSPVADVFALGKVLYQMVTGGGPDEYPFLPESFEKRLASNKELRSQWEELLPVIDRCCDPGPEERFADGAALAAALREIAQPGPRPWRRVALSIGLVGLCALGAWGERFRRDYQVRPGTITLHVLPEDARVTIGDSTYVGGTIHAAGISPGRGSLRIEHPDFHPHEQGMMLEPGQDLRLGQVELRPATGGVSVTTIPPGASISIDGQYLGTTPLEKGLLPPGPHSLRIALEGFRGATREIDIREGELAEVETVPLRFFSPPIPAREWENSLQVRFPARGTRHVAELPITLDELKSYARSGYLDWERIPGIELQSVEGFRFSEDGGSRIALLAQHEVESFAAWLEAQDREAGFLDHMDTYAWRPLGFSAAGEITSGREPYILNTTKRTHVRIALSSSPASAEVWLGGRLEGKTPEGRPLEIARSIRKGVPLVCRCFGYRDFAYSGELRDFGTNRLELRLEPWWGGEPGTLRPRNSLGMELVALGDAFWSTWEVRVSDMEVFCSATGRDPLHRAVFLQEPDHAAVNITLEEAVAFCSWLTEHERSLGLLPPGVAYRLPTDLEWSHAAGIPEPSGFSLQARDASADDRSTYPAPFPWGDAWPPPEGYGNYGFKADEGPVDPYPNTAPAGTFRANPNGLHGISGGVWEWVSDPYPRGEGARSLHVCRGGAFNNNRKHELLAGRRNLVEPGFRDVLYGFRPILVRVTEE